MTKGAKRFRSVICTLLSFLIALSLTLISLLCVVRLTLMNPRFMSYIIDKSGYAQEIHKELKEEFISYGSACNIDESFFDKAFESVVTEQMITDSISDGISGFYSNSVEKVSTDELEGKLLSELRVYAEEKGFRLDEELDESLKNMCGEMGDIYRVYVGMFNSSYFKTASDMLARYMPLFNWALIGLSVFALLAVFIIRLFYARAKNYLRHYIYATAGSTLMLAVAPAAALIMKIGSKVGVANASLYGFVSGVINSFLIAVLISAAVMAVVTVILSAIRYAAIKRA